MRMFSRQLIVIATVACASTQPTASPEGPLADLSWLCGTWVSETEGRVLEEIWSQPRGNTLIGMNRTVRGGEMVFFEHLRIEARADGIYYVAHPSGQRETEFLLTERDEDRATFEAPEHDFPQRIEYWRTHSSLHARISGTQNGERRSNEWQWQLVHQ